MNSPATNSRTIIDRTMIGWWNGRGLRRMIPGVPTSRPITAPIGATTAMWIHSTWEGMSSAVPAILNAVEPRNARMNMKRLAIWMRRNFCRLS